MKLALWGAWGPVSGICHDARGWVPSTNGWTPMHEMPSQKNQNIARLASTNHMCAIPPQVLHELTTDMTTILVAAWPYVECPRCQSDDALHAPKILLISVGRGCAATTALWGRAFQMGRSNFKTQYIQTPPFTIYMNILYTYIYILFP